MFKINDRLDALIKSVSDWFDDLEKVEPGQRRRIVSSAPSKGISDKPVHDLDRNKVSIHTGEIKWGAMGTQDKPRDYATRSTHVVSHNGVPIAHVTVHHAHPRDLGRPIGKLGYAHDHDVTIHAPGVHKDAHAMIAAKVKDHVNSKEFKRIVDKHNEEEHDFTKPKGWMKGTKPPGTPKKKDE